MIGSFWNLCRACPSMPVDKLHSEYRSTYRWHEYTGGSRPEVVRRPPVPNQFASSTDHFFSKSTEEEKIVEGTVNEPPLPRRKKCPELAYKTHEFISCDGPDGADKNISSSVNRARSEERGTPSSRRSKSEGPPGALSGRTYPTMKQEQPVLDQNRSTSGQAGESSGLFKKTITKLSTEYRLQFVWPHVRKTIKGIESDDTIEPPRKSKSMGAIKPTQSNTIATVHKKRTTNKNKAAVHELEPLVNNVEERHPDYLETKMGHKRIYRPQSQYDTADSSQRRSDKENYGFVIEKIESDAKIDNKLIQNGYGLHGQSWYKEVIELRKKADEYKCRGWGIEIDPDLYKKQKELWDQVSRRSSLSALSLASTVRPITKEEKEKENNKKSSPTKAVSARPRIPGQAHPVDNRNFPDSVIAAKLRKETIRHHLGRTTGPDVEEGVLLPSPTRDKLMPTIPKSKEEENYSPQRGSPKKSVTSRHESPQKGSPQKGSPKKMTKGGSFKGRSQSVGPTVNESGGSPKRQTRSGNTAVTNTTATPAKPHKKTPVSTPTVGERRPRPTTLSTTSHSRSKSSSIPFTGNRAQSAPGNHQQFNQSSHYDNNSNTSPSTLTIPNLRKTNKSAKQPRPKSSVINGHSDPMAESIMVRFDQRHTKIDGDKKTAETEHDTAEKDGGGGGTSISSASPLPAQEMAQHIVKSPPEPTRVKSPEQILMRSPDPVNWTVPLDTGKTFTVTQNVRDGEIGIRPQSEFKVSTPVDKPPTAPMSAPPELAEQAKLEAWKSNNEQNIKVPPVPTVVSGDEQKKPAPQPSNPAPVEPAEVRYDKPVPGSTLRCLDDPIYDTAATVATVAAAPATTAATATAPAAAAASSSTATVTVSGDALEKAHDRFDRFWGGNSDKDGKEKANA